MHKRIFTIKRDLNLLKQKMETAGHFVYQGGMFSADKAYLGYVNALDDKSCVQDLNGNPVLIVYIDDFKFKVKSKHQEVMNELYDEYKKITT